MQIAITSQNRKTITEHAGKCRKFWIYDINQEQIAERRLVELPIEQSFHASHGLPEALTGVEVLISRGMGGNLYQRLISLGIQPLLTDSEDPDQAIADFLSGKLETHSLEDGCHEHEHEHSHHHHQHCHGK
ncbi:NifB/NifX family molybdenum-iron cluster-binding protein [Azonexus caeni]|jgi:predicted Fe-Mo cluster-binding NifX family protein|uniref:NifB/NifX family molybdenum-iron cluster-binding protein n=1 Tax=Azonexus caeni TaxID=266126 RepID=UPI003A87FBA9